MKSKSQTTKQYLVVSKRVIILGAVCVLTASTFTFFFSKTAHAALFSFVASIFSQDASAQVGQADQTDSDLNSQTIALPQPAVNTDPNPDKTIATVPVKDGETLVPDMASPNADNANVNTQISTYVIREGDTVESIAKMFGVSVNTILWSNDITKTTKLQIGQTLVILPVSGIKYTVKNGDTVSSIAKKYDADTNDITTYNDLSASTLVVGQSIIIPYAEVEPQMSGSNVASNTGSKTFPNEPVLDNVSDLPSYPGYYARPIAGGYISQYLHGHNAIDFAAPIWTKILAAAKGTVIISRFNGGWNGGYGNFVVISHPNGTQTLYAHMELKQVVTIGQDVAQGQVIGYIGVSGLTTGPHVHFEVRGAKNPFDRSGSLAKN